MSLSLYVKSDMVDTNIALMHVITVRTYLGSHKASSVTLVVDSRGFIGFHGNPLSEIA